MLTSALLRCNRMESKYARYGWSRRASASFFGRSRLAAYWTWQKLGSHFPLMLLCDWLRSRVSWPKHKDRWTWFADGVLYQFQFIFFKQYNVRGRKLLTMFGACCANSPNWFVCFNTPRICYCQIHAAICCCRGCSPLLLLILAAALKMFLQSACCQFLCCFSVFAT